jgi:hypothetical protein
MKRLCCYLLLMIGDLEIFVEAYDRHGGYDDNFHERGGYLKLVVIMVVIM